MSTNILLADLAKVRASIQRLSAKLGVNFALLPVHIDHSEVPYAFAYTTSEGIWISKHVIINEPDDVEVYLAHEIGHHVVRNHEVTSTFNHWTVNVAEDYVINWHIYKLFGYDIRKMKSGKFLFNKRKGAMKLDRLCEEVQKGEQDGIHEKGCSCFGIPHSLIVEAARRIRMQYEPWKSMRHTQPLFYLDDIDRAKYLDVIDSVRYKLNTTRLAVEYTQLLEGLWSHSYLENPIAKLPKGLSLTNTEAAVYAWSRPYGKTYDSALSAFAAMTYMQVMSEHESYLFGRVIRAADRLKKLEGELNALINSGKRRPKAKAKLKLQIVGAKKRLARAEERSKWPLPRLFVEHPVSRVPSVELPIRAVAMRGVDRRKPLSGLPALRKNDTVRELRYLSRITTNRVDKIEDIYDALDEVATPQPSPNTGAHLPPPPGSGPFIPPDGDGPGKAAGKSDSTAQTKLDNLMTIDSDPNLLINILESMREFEAALGKNKKRRPEDSTSHNAVIAYGNDLAATAVTEFSLLGDDPLLRMLFFTKLANHSLTLDLPPEVKRAAVVIAVDCSGSMTGEPYITACGFALAMMKYLSQDKRGCALYTFSDKVGKSVVANGKEIPMQEVLNTLMNVRQGGTSFTNALHGAYNIKANMGWPSLTTLLITDGESHLNNDIRERLRKEKSAEDKIVAVLTSGTDGGLVPFCDDSVTVKKSKLFNELVEQGQALL